MAGIMNTLWDESSELEDEMLTPTLRGRVRYNCTRYVGMDNCHVFEVYLDGTLAKRFSWETVNDWLIENGRREKGYGLQDYWNGFFDLLAAVPPEARTAYTDEEFCEALEIYRNQPIADSNIKTGNLPSLSHW